MDRIEHLNSHESIVQSVSNDKTEITLLLPRGGIVKAKNEGFEVGDHICFLLDPSKTKIIKVIPKTIADLTVAVGSDPIMRAALQEAPEPEEYELDFDEEDSEQFKATEEGYEQGKDEEEGKCSFILGSNSG